MTHVDPGVVLVFDMRRPPHFAQDLAVSQHPARIGRQQRQQPVLDRCQPDGLAGALDATAGEIDLDVADPEHGLACFAAGVAPRQRAHAREQLADSEWFGQVVVGPCVQRPDLVLLLATRRQNQDRRGGPRPHRAHQLDPVAVGQRQIQHHQIRATGGRLRQPLLQRCRFHHAPVLGFERRAHEAADLRLILDNDRHRGRAHPVPVP